MGKTKRRNWFGKAIRDGEHGKKCPSDGCSYCVTGEYKKQARRKLRREKLDNE